MNQIATKEQVKGPAPAGAQSPAVSRLGDWENFRDELAKRADEIGSQLPSNVTRDRFINASIAAVKANPDILAATPRSLFSALTKAAQDGLLPDGREGIITVYKTEAVWNPMFYGIRKRARELDGIIIDAQVVVEGDEYDFALGDDPHITHRPLARSEKMDASKGVAVYAIFRHPEQGILHREWMWKPEVFDVMNQSRAKGSLMWTVFWTEGWKKTVGRRAAKSVPVSAQLERLITRDDENFDFPRDTPRLVPPSPPSPPKLATIEGTRSPTDAQAFLAEIDETLARATTADEVEQFFDELDVQSTLSSDEPGMKAAFETKDRHLARVAPPDEPDFPGDR